MTVDVGSRTVIAHRLSHKDQDEEKDKLARDERRNEVFYPYDFEGCTTGPWEG